MTTIAKKTSPLFKIPIADINDFEAEWNVPFFTFDETYSLSVANLGL